MEEKEFRNWWARATSRWPGLSPYERFEYIVSLILTFILSIVVLLALAQLIQALFTILEFKDGYHVDYKTFQIIFGMLLTVLIAMEFRNSLLCVLEGKGLLAQVQIVILIAIMALARKFVVIDTKDIDAGMILELSAAVFALGLIYWLLKCSAADGSSFFSQLSRGKMFGKQDDK
ncbi:MAG: phosphate-starvation-inducible PsiE family protein [Gammaproteobacteria bacterium]|nr:phosphate-starvation-inducible PsiE family protein [Gammaproteobacteria bacterium]